MPITDRSKTLLATLFLLSVMTTTSYAQQWNGPGNPNGTIWRPGNVALGFEATTGGSEKPLLELKRPMSGGTELLFSARSTYKEATGDRFEIDDLHAYAGGARSKASILPADLDFAVHRKAAIGVVNIKERIPSDYMLVVGGKILAEEVRIKLIKDWADHIFTTDYQLKRLPEIEHFIQTHHHLPDIPSAAEVEADGVSLGQMQSKLLLKIEELTLYLIEQNKTIETLQRTLVRMERNNAQSKTTAHR